jgi:hypothetical protein
LASLLAWILGETVYSEEDFCQILQKIDGKKKNRRKRDKKSSAQMKRNADAFNIQFIAAVSPELEAGRVTR